VNRLLKADVTIVGAGFTGLATAYELSKRGIQVIVLEAESNVGGLAAAFEVGGAKVDRFYHILFMTDRHAIDLLAEIGLGDRVISRPTNAGVYYANNFFKLSTPWDLLKFTALSFKDRIRLGRLILRARRLDHWSTLEDMTAHEWLRELGGESVYRIVWQPLLKGKFGDYAEQVSAVWFWNKLKLRSGTRGGRGEERFAYIKGGFILFAETLADRIRALGGDIHLNCPAFTIQPHGDSWKTTTPEFTVISKRVVATPALPLVAEMIRNWVGDDYHQALNKIKYLGNVCLVLELERSLTQSYWTNVNDPAFPFVGLIEHTNLENASTYGGRHIVYLSKYMRCADPLFSLTADEYLDYAFPYLKTMFPDMERQWIHGCHMWRSSWSQPIVEKSYSKLLPSEDGPRAGFHICSMAQIYPEDRGTNFAIRAGQKLARRIAETMPG